MERSLRGSLANRREGRDISEPQTPIFERSVAGVIRQFGPSYLAQSVRRIPVSHRRAMAALKACRTAALSGHVLECDSCGVQAYAYHSCRHRSCPKCQRDETAEWVRMRLEELLPVPYFHVVFSVPNKLHDVIRAHTRRLYPMIMGAAMSALEEIGANPKYLGGEIGVLATLHTTARTLAYHPHVHCLLPAGSVSADGQWQPATRTDLGPPQVLAAAFRARLLAGMSKAVGRARVPSCKLGPAWKVYVDQPKHGVEAVMNYLGRSVYLGSMDNHRILELTERTVRFEYPCRDHRQRRVMEVGGSEFLRRFLQHVWPPGLHRVRYSGLWSRKRRAQLRSLREQLQSANPKPAAVEVAVSVTPAAAAVVQVQEHWTRCPHCGGQRVPVARFSAGDPPPLKAPDASQQLAIPPPTADLRSAM